MSKKARIVLVPLLAAYAACAEAPVTQPSAGPEGSIVAAAAAGRITTSTAAIGASFSVIGSSGLNTFSSAASFAAAGTVEFTNGFEGFSPTFTLPGDPWTTGWVTYTTGANLIVGTASGYNPPSAVFCYNQWSPMQGSLAGGYDMLGFDVGILGTVSAVTITITTNQRQYVHAGVAIPHWTAGGTFVGFTTKNAGEYITAFHLASSQGSGSAPCLDNVMVGVAGPTDDTPPVIAANVTGTLGDNGWYTSDVNVSWNVTDDESSISATSGCDASAVTSDTEGTTFTCSATSDGGNASASVTVKRDATPPDVTFSGNAGSYTVDQTVSISCSASDATAGVASVDCAGASGPAYGFALGANTLSGSATDNAGNAGSATTSFTVQVTTSSLCALTRQFVSHNGIANSMCAKLQNAEAAFSRGNTSAGRNQVQAYVNEVNAQAGKALTAGQAAILAGLAGAI